MYAREQRPPLYELRINELVLEGFAPGERHAIAAAMERELTRLLSAADAPFATAGARGLSVDSLDAGVFSVADGASPATVGVAAARAVNGSLGTLTAGTASVGTAPAAAPVAGIASPGAGGPKP
jgi:hypothetical protein